MTANQQYQLLNKATAAKTESRGFNLDSLNHGNEQFFSQYDQVQVKNGNQSILLQRNNAGGVSTQTAVMSNGILAAVPDTGALKTNLLNTQAKIATTAKTITNATTPAWERYAIPVIGAAVLLIGGIIVLKRT